jgi:hypothetical protein
MSHIAELNYGFCLAVPSHTWTAFALSVILGVKVLKTASIFPQYLWICIGRHDEEAQLKLSPRAVVSRRGGCAPLTANPNCGDRCDSFHRVLVNARLIPRNKYYY